MKKHLTTHQDLKINYDYFEMKSSVYVKKWKKIARQNRWNKILKEETEQQVGYELQEARLRIDFEHNLIKEQEEAIKEEQKKKLQDLTQNFGQYVEAEKAKLPERYFKRIDFLKAPLEKLKEKIEEFKQSISFK